MAGKDAKNAKFRELAEKRMDKALQAIERLGKLSNRQLYAYDELEIRKMMKALRDEVSKAESRFQDSQPKEGKRFEF